MSSPERLRSWSCLPFLPILRRADLEQQGTRRLLSVVHVAASYARSCQTGICEPFALQVIILGKYLGKLLALGPRHDDHWKLLLLLQNRLEWELFIISM
jgi:hypothetical protein